MGRCCSNTQTCLKRLAETGMEMANCSIGNKETPGQATGTYKKGLPPGVNWVLPATADLHSHLSAAGQKLKQNYHLHYLNPLGKSAASPSQLPNTSERPNHPEAFSVGINHHTQKKKRVFLKMPRSSWISLFQRKETCKCSCDGSLTWCQPSYLHHFPLTG